MNKKNLIEHFKKQIAEELIAITAAAKNTYDIATHEENKPENEYDTRGLEASYLAGAQAQRVTEMKDVLAVFENYKIKDFTKQDIIGATALVEVDLEGKISYVLIMPKGGGQATQFEGHHIQVITPESPLGYALIGKHVGDIADVDMGSKTREYEIISIQ